MKYAVVANDSGGAELLSSYVKKKKLNSLFSLSGPALKVFNNKLGLIDNKELDYVILKSDVLICGTSWQSNLELDAIKLAKKHGKKSIAFLDHWVNYENRFKRGNENYLPDEIWVCDTNALKIVEKEFPKVKANIVTNYYLEEVKNLLNNEYHRNKYLSVLFIGENISEHALKLFNNDMYFGYNEIDVLNYFIFGIIDLKIDIGKLIIRPHPSEDSEKYINIIKKSEINIKIELSKSTLVEDINNADMIVGGTSMALAIASMAKNKIVISSIPPEFKMPDWPFNNILELRNILANKEKFKNIFK